MVHTPTDPPLGPPDLAPPGPPGDGVPEQLRLAMMEISAGRAAAERELAEVRRELLRCEVELAEGRQVAVERDEARQGVLQAEAAAARWQRRCGDTEAEMESLKKVVAELSESVLSFKVEAAQRAEREAAVAEQLEVLHKKAAATAAAHAVETAQLHAQLEEQRLRFTRAQSDLQTHIQNHRSAEAAGERTLRTLQARLNDAENAASDYETRCLAAQREAKALKQQVEGLTRQCEDADAAAQAAMADLRALKRQHAQCPAREDALADQLQEARQILHASEREALRVERAYAEEREELVETVARLRGRVAAAAAAAPPAPPPPPAAPSSNLLVVVARDVAQIVGCYDMVPHVQWEGRPVWGHGEFRLYAHGGRWMVSGSPQHMGSGRGFLRSVDPATTHPGRVHQWQRCAGGDWVASKTAVHGLHCAGDETAARYLMDMLRQSVDALRGVRRELRALQQQERGVHAQGAPAAAAAAAAAADSRAGLLFPPLQLHPAVASGVLPDDAPAAAAAAAASPPGRPIAADERAIGRGHARRPMPARGSVARDLDGTPAGHAAAGPPPAAPPPPAVGAPPTTPQRPLPERCAAHPPPSASSLGALSLSPRTDATVLSPHLEQFMDDLFARAGGGGGGDPVTTPVHQRSRRDTLPMSASPVHPRGIQDVLEPPPCEPLGEAELPLPPPPQAAATTRRGAAGVSSSGGGAPPSPRPGEAVRVAGVGRGRRTERFKPVRVVRQAVEEPPSPPPPPPPPVEDSDSSDTESSSDGRHEGHSSVSSDSECSAGTTSVGSARGYAPGEAAASGRPAAVEGFAEETETADVVDTPPGAPHAATSPAEHPAHAHHHVHHAHAVHVMGGVAVAGGGADVAYEHQYVQEETAGGAGGDGGDDGGRGGGAISSEAPPAFQSFYNLTPTARAARDDDAGEHPAVEVSPAFESYYDRRIPEAAGDGTPSLCSALSHAIADLHSVCPLSNGSSAPPPACHMRPIHPAAPADTPRYDPAMPSDDESESNADTAHRRGNGIVDGTHDNAWDVAGGAGGCTGTSPPAAPPIRSPSPTKKLPAHAAQGMQGAMLAAQVQALQMQIQMQVQMQGHAAPPPPDAHDYDDAEYLGFDTSIL